METEPYVPLSVRYGGPRKKFSWWLKGRRQDVALWLAPWFSGASEQRDEWRERAFYNGVERDRYKQALEDLLALRSSVDGYPLVNNHQAREIIESTLPK